MGESQGASLPTLETAGLLLRPFEGGDLEGLTCFFADPGATRYLPRVTASPRERAQRVMTRALEHWERYGYGVWAVVEKSDGTFVGYCGLNWVPEADAVEIDYGLLQKHWGRGIATEAARASADFGFAEIKLGRIIGLVAPENTASRRVLEHLGMTYARDVHFWGLDLRWYEVEPDAFRDQAAQSDDGGLRLPRRQTPHPSGPPCGPLSELVSETQNLLLDMAQLCPYTRVNRVKEFTNVN